MDKIAVFPGSFDPVTRGHESIVLRALPLFDKIYVSIGDNAQKNYYFPKEKRIQWLEEVFRDYPQIEIGYYSGLTVNYCKEVGATYLLRGLRTSADFEFERTIGHINRMISDGIETVFLLAFQEFSALNSSVVRDILRYGGDASMFVPPAVTFD